MIDEVVQIHPSAYDSIKKATEALGFLQMSEISTCSLLKTLAASKPSGEFLELGTGTGLATAWILDGMDEESTLISLDNDETLLNVAKENLGVDKRLKLICTDGNEWLKGIVRLIEQRLNVRRGKYRDGRFCLLVSNHPGKRASTFGQITVCGPITECDDNGPHSVFGFGSQREIAQPSVKVTRPQVRHRLAGESRG